MFKRIIKNKTYAEDFIKKFPNCQRCKLGLPVSLWCNVYNNGKCNQANNPYKQCKDCWKQSMK